MDKREMKKNRVTMLGICRGIVMQTFKITGVVWDSEIKYYPYAMI